MNFNVTDIITLYELLEDSSGPFSRRHLELHCSSTTTCLRRQ